MLRHLANARRERDGAHVVEAWWLTGLGDEHCERPFPLVWDLAARPRLVNDFGKVVYRLIVQVPEGLVRDAIGTGGGLAVELVQRPPYSFGADVDVQLGVG